MFPTRVRPTTGRFHQVRRHVRDLHHPSETLSTVTRASIAGGGRTQKPIGWACISFTSLDMPDGSEVNVSCPLFGILLSSRPCLGGTTPAQPSQS